MIEQILKVALGCSIAAMVVCEFFMERLTTELVRLIEVVPRQKGVSKKESSKYESISVQPLYKRAVASSRLPGNMTNRAIKDLFADPQYAAWRERYSRVEAANALSLVAFIAIIFGLVAVHENAK